MYTTKRLAHNRVSLFVVYMQNTYCLSYILYVGICLFMLFLFSNVLIYRVHDFRLPVKGLIS